MVNTQEIVEMTTLAARLRNKRRQRGWTQERLAEAAGTTQAVIQKIENGKSLRPRRIDHIASALACSPAWLMFGTTESNGLDRDAQEVGKAWAQLPEPYRSLWKERILSAAANPEAA